MYLLDVNVLLAFAYQQQACHLRVRRHYKVQFATVDSGIPGALLIPEHVGPHDEVREPALAYGAAA
jgi:hypothetical protein